MSPKKALEILQSEEEVSIDDILEAHKVLAKAEKPKKNKTRADEIRSFNKYRQNRRKDADFRAELRKHWKKSS